MAKNIISNAPLENHPYIFLNETTGDHVFALTQFVTSLHGVELTKETKAAFNAFALEFINEHGLERVTFSNARGLIFVKFDIAAINDPDAYRLMVLFALMAGGKFFNISLELSNTDAGLLDKKTFKTLFPTLKRYKNAKDRVMYPFALKISDIFIEQLIEAPTAKGISFSDTALPAHNPKSFVRRDCDGPKIPSFYVLGINKLDSRLMINVQALCTLVAFTVLPIIKGQDPRGLRNLSIQALDADLFLLLKFECLCGLIDDYYDSFMDRSAFFFAECPYNPCYYHTNELAKAFALEALQYVYFDLTLSNQGYGVNSFIEYAPVLVNHVASYVFDFKGAATNEYERFCNDILSAFSEFLLKQRQYIIKELMEDMQTS